jgi:pilus assembly protein CpaC
MSRSTMTRRLKAPAAATLAALVAFSSAAPSFADGPVGGSHVYRPAPRVVRPTRPTPVAAAPLPATDRVLSIDLTAGAGARVLDLPLGKSAIIELPTDVRDMLVTNPLVADAVLRSPRRIYVVGLTAGATDAVFFDEAGRRILQLNIRVGQDTSLLSSTLNNVIKGGTIKVVPLKDSVILSGIVMNAADSEKASRIAAQFVASDDKVLNMLSIAGKDQVMLEVRIVEVQRNVIKQLGVDLNAVLGQLGQTQYSFGLSPTYGVNGSLLGGVKAGYSADSTKASVIKRAVKVPITTCDATGCTTTETLQTYDFVDSNDPLATTQTVAGDTGLNSAKGMIQAFERVGLVRTLAEPNLTVLSGESGKFLAGGEFPVPVAADTTGKISIEFKPYGVGLGYTPVVLSGGRISLKLSTEVSELSSLGAYSVAAGNTNLTVPGLTVRRAETTVELPSGGSLMIAGLLQQTTKQTIDAIPGMTNMPVLGALFRSRDFLNGETELVIIITPYIVDSTRPQNLQTPADGLRIAGDMSTVLLGRLNKVVKAPAGANAGRAYQGPVGYVIE